MMKHKVYELVQIIDKEDVHMVEDALNMIIKYVNAVYNMENAMQTARFRLDVKEYALYINNLDHARKDAHDAAIISLNIINRLAVFYKQDIIFNHEGMHRTDIAEKIIFPFVMEVLHGRTKDFNGDILNELA